MELHALGGEPGDDVVLLLHGFGADRHAWVGNAPALFDHAEVLAGELAGHGAAAGERIDTFESLVDDALNELSGDNRWQGAKRRHVVGHSLGGALAIALAARSEQPMASLTAIAPAGLGASIDLDWLRALVSLDDAAAARSHLQRMVSNPRLIAPQVAPMLLKHLDGTGVRDTLAALVENVPTIEVSLSADLAALGALPRTLIWGEDDRINPACDDTFRRFGGDTFKLADCAHLPQIERRSEVNRAITARIAAT